MKYLLALPALALLASCQYITVTSGGGDVTNISMTKDVPVVVGKDIQDTAKTRVEPLAPEAAIETTTADGKAVPLYINLPSKALDY